MAFKKEKNSLEVCRKLEKVRLICMLNWVWIVLGKAATRWNKVRIKNKKTRSGGSSMVQFKVIKGEHPPLVIWAFIIQIGCVYQSINFCGFVFHV